MRKPLRTTLAAAALVAGFNLLPAPASGAVEPPAAAAVVAPAPAGRVIVRFKNDSPLMQMQASTATGPHAARAAALGQRLGLAMRSGGGLAERMQVLHADGMRSEALAARLRQQPDVEFAVVDQRRRLLAAPNDPRYLSVPQPPGPAVGQWYLRAPDATVRSSIDVERAWDVTIGSRSIVVAVLDTGVRFDHADLPLFAAGGSLLPGYDMVSDVNTANDGDGRDADPSDPGDFITTRENLQADGPFQNCGASDSSWHGTNMAGIIAAATDNGIGMAGIGRQVSLLPVRVLGKCGGFDSDIIAGARWAAGLPVPGVPANPNPARVLNLSLGSEGACTSAYRSAIDEIRATGAVIVASAGNSAGHAVSTPANCPGVIAVGGLRHVGTKVGFSDLGTEIALSAPGGNCVDITPGAPCRYPILATTNAGKTAPIPGSSAYTDSSNISVGTSYAAPLVAGTAALMLSAQPGLSSDEIRRRLQQTVRAFPTTGGDNGSDPAAVVQCTAPQTDSSGRAVDQLQCYCTTSTCGAGMLDAGAAVRAALAPMAAIGFAPTFPIAAQTLTLSAATSSAAAGRPLQRFSWQIADSGGIVGGFASSPDAPTVNIVPTAPGRFAVALTVTDSFGAVATTTQAIDVHAPGTAPDTNSPSGAGGGGGGGALDWQWLAALLAAIVMLRRDLQPAR